MDTLTPSDKITGKMSTNKFKDPLKTGSPERSLRTPPSGDTLQIRQTASKIRIVWKTSLLPQNQSFLGLSF